MFKHKADELAHFAPSTRQEAAEGTVKKKSPGINSNTLQRR
jgi:hypothetical protein